MKATARPIVILGLCSFTHDSAATLLVGGVVKGFVEEERLSGKKHTRAFPSRSIEWLLHEAGLSRQDVTDVAYNFKGTWYLKALQGLPRDLIASSTRRRAVARGRSFAAVYLNFRHRMQYLSNLFPSASLHSVSHHLTHGLYAFASSGYDRAAVLVVDSLGEVQTTTLGAFERRGDQGCGFKLIDAINDPASLGYAYGAITEHLGWRRGDEEGTVMALASLGDPARFRSVMTSAIPLTETGFSLNPELLPLRVLSKRFDRVSNRLAAETCLPRRPGDEVTQVHADLAAAIQERTEHVMLHLAIRARRSTGLGLLCVGGGVAANCVAIGKIVSAGIYDEVHVPPAPGDSGTALGAASAVQLRRTGRLPQGIEGKCFMGPAFPGIWLPKRPRPGLQALRPSHTARLMAEELAAGSSVGLFQGSVEAGPRALGNRSILASPLLPDVVQRLNGSVKHRESFRPFAPVVLADEASRYFHLNQESPYMSIAAPATTLALDCISTVVHKNGTSRVQTVNAQQNPFLAKVLREFAEITGVPVLINTSLNIKGAPICGTPDLALECLRSTGLDALLLEGWWVTKCA